MLSNYVNSIIRTGVGYALAWLLSLKLAGPVVTLVGVNTPTARERVITGAIVIGGTAYYAAARVLERRWPQLTVLLGSTLQPIGYTTTVTPEPSHAAVTPPAGVKGVSQTDIADVPPWQG
jgi:hypothetical protein